MTKMVMKRRQKKKERMGNDPGKIQGRRCQSVILVVKVLMRRIKRMIVGQEMV